MQITEQIVLVESALQDLIRDWERYFAGDLKVPPKPKHERIERRLRHLSGQPVQRRADQFRLEQLQHRFMAYATNWNRMLRELEEGRGRFARAAAPGRPAPAPANAGSGSSVDSGEDRTLYDRYVAAKRAHGEEVRLDREAFEAQLSSERSKLEERLGQHVQFDVMVDNGKVKLAARKATRDTGRK